ncbi:MAG: DNA-directed DNA polymerase II small subunit [Promethearchaeota archaeon]
MNGIKSKEGNSEEKKIIVDKLVKSGINITPSTLNFVLNLDNPLEKVNLIIKKTSFIPKFNSHLTEKILKKISDEEIQKILKRSLFKEASYSNDVFLRKNDNSIETNTTYLEKYNEKNNKESIKKINTDYSSIESSTNLSLKDSRNISNSKELFKKVENKKLRTKLIETTKSAFSFKPIAREYNSEYEILKDPTGKLYSSGDYNDFYDLTLDKFNQLKGLMRKRGDVLSATNINNLLRTSQNNNLSIIGLVKEIRQTKNGNYLLSLEDLTGTVNVLVSKNSENQDIIKITERIIDDQMLFVEGLYNPGEKGKKGIIFANNISKVDIPTDYIPKKSPDPLSIVLLSDTHIGSREFEEPLWNKFVDFLNGKVGNKNLREIAGKVKYIIINGDLVDGIGIYPNQESDLLITDIYKQFKKASELISNLPDYIEVFYSPGNHDPVRNALPRPAVPKKYAEDLINIGVKCLGNPSVVKTHNVSTLLFHGDSMLDMNMLIAGLENNNPVETMKELLTCRHLAPIYGKKTQIAPTSKDWLVIDEIPDIFHTGHIHINGMGQYRNVSLVNSGCFQSQTEFMNSIGIHPTPGIVSLIELDSHKGLELDLKKFN